MQKYRVRVRSWFSALLVGLFGLSSLSVTSAIAQATESRSLVIRDGAVFLDGERLTSDELPPSLDTKDIQLHYTFSGDVRPVIDVNGAYFVIESDGIREVAEGEQKGVSVFLRQNGPVRAPDSDRVAFSNQNLPDITSFAAPHAASIERQARELQAQAVHFQELQARLQEGFGDRQVEELYEAAQRLGRQAQQAARAAEALPHIEVQHYLEGIQREDRELYDRLVDEREMESESIRLSREIRAVENEQERVERIGELRAKLDEIFELKQANRRREIEQFENRLEDLQRKLEERERLRDQIIDGRLRQLLDQEDVTNW